MCQFFSFNMDYEGNIYHLCPDLIDMKEFQGVKVKSVSTQLDPNSHSTINRMFGLDRHRRDRINDPANDQNKARSAKFEYPVVYSHNPRSLSITTLRIDYDPGWLTDWHKELASAFCQTIEWDLEKIVAGKYIPLYGREYLKFYYADKNWDSVLLADIERRGTTMFDWMEYFGKTKREVLMLFEPVIWSRLQEHRYSDYKDCSGLYEIVNTIVPYADRREAILTGRDPDGNRIKRAIRKRLLISLSVDEMHKFKRSRRLHLIPEPWLSRVRAAIANHRYRARWARQYKKERPSSDTHPRVSDWQVYGMGR
ncbi:MAG: hypothetical protein ACXAAP_14805 [Candidatus Thorarchaeota archaeon]